MQNPFIDRLEKTREQIVSWSNERFDELKTQSEGFASRRDELLSRGNTKFDQAAGALRGAEATVLETARDLLNRANETFDGKAAFLKRGAEALDEALTDLLAGRAATMPIEGFDALSIKKILPFLADLSAAQLGTVRVYEAANKARKTLLKELDARIEALGTA
jgi:hypothetical protein